MKPVTTTFAEVGGVPIEKSLLWLHIPGAVVYRKSDEYEYTWKILEQPDRIRNHHKTCLVDK
jgi:hypothetical protein